MMMSKTEIKDGKVYEIGKLYFFYDGDDEKYCLHVLEGITGGSRPFLSKNGHSYKYCKEVSSISGTITDAPIELMDGNAYMFEFEGNEMVGVYCIDELIFYTKGLELQIEHCTNIREMVVKEND